MNNVTPLATDQREVLGWAYRASIVDTILGTTDASYVEGARSIMEAIIPTGDLYYYTTFQTEAKLGKRWHFVGWSPLTPIVPEHKRFELRKGWLVEINTWNNEETRYDVADLLPFMKTSK